MNTFVQTYLNTNQSICVQYENFEMIFFNKISFVINFMLILIGIIDNSFCIYVFLQRNMIKIKFNWYLLIIAIFELLFCLILFIDYSFRLVYKTPMFLHDLNVIANMIIDYSLHLIDSFVTIITMILSIDRYQAIKNPTQIRKLFTYMHSKRLVRMTFISLVILKIPGFKICYENTEKNFNNIYCTVVTPFLLNVLPTFSILVINILLFRKISRSHLNRGISFISHGSSKRNSEVSKRSNSSASVKTYSLSSRACTQKSQYVMIVLSSWLIITTFPYYSINIFYSIFQLKSILDANDFKIVIKAHTLFSILFNLNHILNFFIYYCFNFEFRRLMLKRIQNLKTSRSQLFSTLNTSNL